jgi:NAD(P) transhydrogenase
METTLTANGCDYDLLVIGGGPAGQKGALCAAKFKKKTAIVDRKWPAGNSSGRGGTISSKTLREAILSRLRQRSFNQQAPSNERLEASIRNFGMADLTTRVEAVIKSEAELIKSQLQRHHVDLLEGDCAFIDSHTVQIQTEQGSSRVTAANFLIAVGTRPLSNDRIPIDGKHIHNSDQFLSLPEIPNDVIIVGAGLIGIEYASLLAALGVRVTLVDQRTAFLSFADREIVDAFRSELSQSGVVFRLGEKVVACGVEAGAAGVFAILESGENIRGQSLLYTVGRQGNTDRLNLEAAGLQTGEAGKLEVNEQFRTAVPNIYAAGDVIGFPVEELYYASISMEQGRLAACNIFGVPAISRPQVFPYTIYAIPEISMVGHTEQYLIAKQVSYQAGVARYGELAKGQILGAHHGFLKLLFDPDSLKILGVHIIGESAAEIIHTGQAVLAFGGTIEYFRDTVFNYPTLAEAYKAAAIDGLRKVGLEL